MGVGFFNALLVLKAPSVEGRLDWRQKVKSIGVEGAFSLVFGVGLFLLGLDRGSNNC